MSIIDLRFARISGNDRRVRYVELKREDLREAFGFDLGGVLDRLGEATIGTRAELLVETGRTGGRLCVIFPAENRIVPALLWTLTRALSVARPDGPVLTEPRVIRRAPTINELALGE
jgi:hypothetical protein